MKTFLEDLYDVLRDYQRGRLGGRPVVTGQLDRALTEAMERIVEARDRCSAPGPESVQLLAAIVEARRLLADFVEVTDNKYDRPAMALRILEAAIAASGVGEG